MNASNRTLNEQDSRITLQDQLEDRGWRLSFPIDLEHEYQRDYADRYYDQILLAMNLGLLSILACGIGDWLWLRAEQASLWWIRMIVLVLMLVLMILARQPSLHYRTQWLIVIDGQIATLGILSFAGIAAPPIRYYYQGGLLLVMLIIFVLSRIQFSYGVVCAICMTIISNIFFWMINHDPIVMIVAQEFILLCGLGFVLTGTFLIDRTLRQNYLQLRLLNEGNQKLQDDNLRLEYLTALDGLTMIANRRTLDSTLKTEFARNKRKNTFISLLMIDVDYFKLYNDTYGHPAGDNCLKNIADTLQQFARRPGDMAGRYGGEEFAVILSNTSLTDACTIAESIRSEILALAIPHVRSQHGTVTVSIGVSGLQPTHEDQPEELYQQADEALYAAKHRGRNCVVLAHQESP